MTPGQLGNLIEVWQKRNDGRSASETYFDLEALFEKKQRPDLYTFDAVNALIWYIGTLELALDRLHGEVEPPSQLI